MITTAAEYYKNLYQIQTNYKPDPTFRLPSDETVYDINLNTRLIKAPTYLSVARDHEAETIYFKCDRYFDDVDLTTKVGIVQYINANNEGGLFVVPFYDIETEEGKIIFPWVISGKATEAAGNVKFAVQFYSLNDDRTFSYNLNTQQSTSKVLHGMDVADEVADKYDFNATLLDEINQRLYEYAQQATLNWLDLSELGVDNDSPASDEDYKVIETITGEKVKG